MSPAPIHHYHFILPKHLPLHQPRHHPHLRHPQRLITMKFVPTRLVGNDLVGHGKLWTGKRNSFVMMTRFDVRILVPWDEPLGIVASVDPFVVEGAMSHVSLQSRILHKSNQLLLLDTTMITRAMVILHQARPLLGTFGRDRGMVPW